MAFMGGMPRTGEEKRSIYLVTGTILFYAIQASPEQSTQM